MTQINMLFTNYLQYTMCPVPITHAWEISLVNAPLVIPRLDVSKSDIIRIFVTVTDEANKKQLGDKSTSAVCTYLL